MRRSNIGTSVRPSRARCTDLRGGNAAGGWVSAECVVAAVMIVGVQPVGERGTAVGLRPVRAGVGPFLEQGAVEPFDLAVGLRLVCGW